MKNKKLLIIIIASVVVLAVLIFLLVKYFNTPKLQSQTPNSQNNVFRPDILSVGEKESLGIHTDLPVQATKRDASGTVMVYRIVKNNDPVNPANVGPISPRLK